MRTDMDRPQARRTLENISARRIRPGPGWVRAGAGPGWPFRGVQRCAHRASPDPGIDRE